MHVVPRFSDELTLLSFADDNIDETYGVNVQFESDEEVRDEAAGCQRSLCAVPSLRATSQGQRLSRFTRSCWEVGISLGWDVTARKEKPNYFRCRFLAWGGFVDYPANPRLIMSQYDGKQMVIFRSRGET